MNIKHSIIILAFSIFIVVSVGAQPPPAKVPSGPKTNVPKTSVPSQISSKPQKSIEIRLNDIERSIEKIKKPQKDLWDKFQAISGLITGGVIVILTTIITLVVTNRQKERERIAQEAENERQRLAQESENERQRIAQEAENERQRKSQEAQNAKELSVLQVQTVQGFMPYLVSDSPSSVKAALLAIESLGNPELTNKLAMLFGGAGAIEALLKVTESRTEPLKESAQSALGAITKSYKSSVVQIIRDEGVYATGFFIDTEGGVVTTAHVVNMLRSDEKLKIKLSDGTKYICTVESIDHNRDLAIIRASDISSQPLPTSERKDAALFDSVAVIAHSAKLDWTAQVGTVKGVVTEGGPAHAERIAVDMESRPGFSGAPVIDKSGMVIGILAAYMPQTKTTLVIPSKSLLEMENALDRKIDNTV